MPFYIRKSISAGPFRFNLSKSGIGLSVGIRGLRVGTGPRGHYVHAGFGGLYYRSSIGRAGQKSTPRSSRPPSQSPAVQSSEYYHPTVTMVEVESSDVLQMADSRFQTILDDLNGRADQVRMSAVLLGAGTFIFVIACMAGGAAAFPSLILAALMWAAGAYIDSYRRASVVFYDVEGEAFHAYERMISAFETLAACRGKWHVAAGGTVRDIHTWKRSAGASHLVAKSPTALTFSLPKVLKCNLTPPSFGVGKQQLYLLPDVALLQHDGRFGAIAYENLDISFQDSRFIEEGPVPADAKVVSYTWRFVNKNGSPDKRFNNNRQIPICLYEAMHLRSSGGLNELLEFSRTGVAGPFREAVSQLANTLKHTALIAPRALEAGAR